MAQQSIGSFSPNPMSKESKLLKELAEPKVKTSIKSRGGGVPIGGGVPVGGSLAVAARMSLPKNHFEMYHQLLRMRPTEWEMMREAAGRQIGLPRSPMWHAMPREGLQAPEHQYMKVAEVHHPAIAAKLMEHEALQNGGGFFSAMKHVLGIAVKGFNGFKKIMKPVLQNKDLLKELPVIGQYVQPGAAFLEKAFDIGDIAASGIEKLTGGTQPFQQSDAPDVS